MAARERKTIKIKQFKLFGGEKMGKYKLVISIMIVTAMLASLACSQKLDFKTTTAATTTAATTTEETSETKPSETETSENETETSETSESSETSETKETAATSESKETATSESTSESSEETTKADSGLNTVSVYNAYKRSFKVGKKSVTTRYPKIMIKGVNTNKVNKEIADKFKPIAKKNKSRVTYSYYVRKYLISVLVTVELEAGNSEFKNFYVYNVSRINGKKLTRDQVLKSLGLKSSTFNTKVKAGIQKMWKTDYKKDTSAAKKKMEANSLKTSTLNSAMPFMNANGKISYLVRQIEVPGQMSHIDLKGTI